MYKNLIIFLCFLTTACGSGIKEIKSISEYEVPEWYLDQEVNDKFIFGYGYGADINKQIAFEKAKSFAINDINQKLELTAINKSSNTLLANNEKSSSQMKIEIKVQSNNTLINYQVMKKGIFIKNDIFNYYLILKYPKSII